MSHFILELIKTNLGRILTDAKEAELNKPKTETAWGFESFLWSPLDVQLH